MKMTKIDFYLYFVTGVKRQQERLDKFTDRLKKEPGEAFNWGMDAVYAAAYIETAKSIISYLGTAETDNVIVKLKLLLENKVFNYARFPQRSTSTMSNLVNECRGSVNAEFLEFVSSVTLVNGEGSEV